MRNLVFSRDADGRPVQTLGMAQDITERKETENALRENRRFIDGVVEATPTAVYVYDLLEQTYFFINDQASNSLGYTVEEIKQIAHKVLDLVHPEDRELVERTRAAVFNSVDNEIVEYEYRIQHANGKWRWLHNRSRVFNRDAGGRPTHTMGITEDITERKQAELDLRDTQSHLRSLLANLPVVVFALDSDGVFTHSDGRGLHALDRKSGEVVGQSIFEYYAEVPSILERVRSALAGEASSLIVEVKGATFYARYEPVRDVSGTVVGVVGTALDVTQHQKATRELAVADERNRLAREIHDTLAQSLTALVFHLANAERLLSTDVEAATLEIKRASSVAVDSMNEARRSLWGLQPRSLESGSLTEALEHEVAKASSSSLEVSIEVVGSEPARWTGLVS